MAEMPPAGRGRNPFGPVESSGVVAALKTAGSYDPDVLDAARRRMLAPYRDLRRVAIAGIVLGCALIFLASMPIFGLFAFVGSAVVWRFQARQVANIEAGYAQFLASGRS